MKNQSKPKERPRPKFPIKMSCLTILILAPIILTHLFPEKVLDTLPGWEAAFANLLLYFGIFLLTLAWGIWLVFFSRRRFLVSKVFPIVVLLVLGTLLYLFPAEFNGSMAIARFRYRYGKIKYEQLIPTGAKITLTSSAREQNFSQFLGPDRNGIVSGINIKPDWDANLPHLLWKKEIGQGWCGFAAYGGFVYTIEQRNELEIVTCRSINNGDVIWKHEHQQRHQEALGGVGPRSTPTVHDGRVYAQGGTGILMCLDAETGELVWEKNIPELVGITMTEMKNANGVGYFVEDSTLNWGRAASPLIYKDQVIIPGGGPANGKQVTFLAFAVKDGKELWRGGDLAIAYGSPSLATIDGVEQILMISEDKAAGFEVETGTVLWSYDRPGHSNGDANSQQIVVVDSNRLLLAKGYGLGAELIHVEQNDSVWQVSSTWKNQSVMKTKFTNAMVKGKHAYGISEKVLECIEIETGEKIWRNLRVGHGQMLIVGDYLLVQTEKGDVVLVDAKPEWNGIQGRVRRIIRGRCWNTICLQDHYLLIRSDKEAACIELPVAPASAGNPNNQ